MTQLAGDTIVLLLTPAFVRGSGACASLHQVKPTSQLPFLHLKLHLIKESKLADFAVAEHFQNDQFVEIR